MTRRSIAIRTGIAAVALTALGLVAASPASAHTNNMYTYVTYDQATESSSYATYGKTDGVVTSLPTLFEPVDERVVGLEVANEVGTEVGFTGDIGPYVLAWDHTTGAIGDYLAAYLAEEELDDFTGLDTLNDGTTITLVNYDDEITEDLFVEAWQIASVNKGTGELTLLVDITDAVTVEGEVRYYLSSLATDPATGITYVFLQDQDSFEVYFLPVTVSTGVVGEVTLFQGEYVSSGGQIFGADFDPGDGSLYFNFDNYSAGEFQLLKLGAPSTWVTAEPTFISPAPAQSDTIGIAINTLTIEHTVLAATGSEIPIALWLAVGTVAVAVGGVTVVVARRRSEAGTV